METLETCRTVHAPVQQHSQPVLGPQQFHAAHGMAFDWRDHPAVHTTLCTMAKIWRYLWPKNPKHTMESIFPFLHASMLR